MTIIHSFLRRFKDKYKYFRLEQYRPAMMITAYTLIAVILILSAEQYYSSGIEVVTVHAKTNFKYIEFEEEETESKAVLLADDINEIAIEDKLTSYLELSTLDGMTALATEQIAKIQEKEAALALIMDAEEERKSDKAREAALDERQLAIEKQTQAEEEAKRQEEEQKALEEEQKKAEAEKKKAEEEKKKAEEEKKKQESNEYKINLSSSERRVLEKIVQAEAGNQDAKGKMLVANVVLNRMKSSKFPDTVTEVVFQHSGSTYQFSPAKSGSIHRVKVTNATKKAVDRVLKGEDYSKGALYFVARKSANTNSLSWFDRKLTKLFKHGAHTFYK